MEKRLQRRIPLLMGMLMLTAGCASITRGVDADPSGIQVFRYSGIGEITRDTISDPAVWLPLAGAAVLQIGDWDRRVSNWARSSTPVFGSTQSAERWSDRLRAFPAVFEAGSVLLQPGGDDLGSWLTSKAQVGAVDLVAV